MYECICVWGGDGAWRMCEGLNATRNGKKKMREDEDEPPTHGSRMMVAQFLAGPATNDGCTSSMEKCTPQHGGRIDLGR